MNNGVLINHYTEVKISMFVQNIASHVGNKFILMSGDEFVQMEEFELSTLFGKHWKYLLPNSRSSLVSAGVLLKKCLDINILDFDFSGICICVTSALEIELKRIFFDGLLSYMRKKYGDNFEEYGDLEQVYDYWSERLLTVSKKDFLEGNHKIKIDNYFTMGALPFLFGETRALSKDIKTRYQQMEQAKFMQEVMRGYLHEIVVDEYLSDPYGVFYDLKETDKSINCKKGCFVWKCEQIRNDYRNKAAHISVMSEKDATDCYQAIVNKPDVYMYNAQVTGLILELYRKIDINKIIKLEK